MRKTFFECDMKSYSYQLKEYVDYFRNIQISRIFFINTGA